MRETTLAIDPLSAADWPSVRDIFEEGIRSADATFERETPDWGAWDAAHLAAARLVARHSSEVLGWAALSPVSNRCVYAGVAEVSVYVALRAARRGVGTSLLEALVATAEHEGIWTLQAHVFPENRASRALFARCGFRLVGVRERFGQMGGRWRDVLLLERRSQVR